jgi:acyl-CoA reductase-like NAD-dependent aldehyde dehydrogenase
MTTATQTFLKQSPIKHFYGGAEHASANGETYAVINPSDGEVLATVSDGAAADVEQAVAAAHRAFPAWAAIPVRERSVLLHRLADAIEREVETFAEIESLDVGKPINASRTGDIAMAKDCIRYYADLAVHTPINIPLPIKNMDAHIHRAPYGVCGFIFPWNFPFLLLFWGIAPALAAGNTVVVKPSEITPLSSLYLARVAREVGFPPGVINVVVGTGIAVGAPLANHRLVRRMSFTGSPTVGKAIGAICGLRLIPCKLELGGKGAAIVFDDVDVESSSKQLAGAITFNTGQVCCTATRWLVHEKIYDQFVENVSGKLKKTKIGPVLDPTTEMGPAASAVHLKRIHDYVARGVKEGATVLLEGGAPKNAPNSGGFYTTPTLLAGDLKNVCFREEIFGPVAYITRFRDEDQAINDINAVEYGLANSVWSADLKRANRVAEKLVAGNSWINAHNVFAYGLAYGGVNLSGIGGGVNGPDTLLDYYRAQTVARPL